jgi:hypothetical protein
VKAVSAAVEGPGAALIDDADLEAEFGQPECANQPRRPCSHNEDVHVAFIFLAMTGAVDAVCTWGGRIIHCVQLGLPYRTLEFDIAMQQRGKTFMLKFSALQHCLSTIFRRPSQLWPRRPSSHSYGARAKVGSRRRGRGGGGLLANRRRGRSFHFFSVTKPSVANGIYLSTWTLTVWLS